MNDLTLVLRFTTLIETKTVLPEYNKLELQSVSVDQEWQL